MPEIGADIHGRSSTHRATAATVTARADRECSTRWSSSRVVMLQRHWWQPFSRHMPFSRPAQGMANTWICKVLAAAASRNVIEAQKACTTPRDIPPQLVLQLLCMLRGRLAGFRPATISSRSAWCQQLLKGGWRVGARAAGGSHRSGCA